LVEDERVLARELGQDARTLLGRARGKRRFAEEGEVELGLELVRERRRERASAAHVVPAGERDAGPPRGVDEDVLVDLGQREELGEALLALAAELHRLAAEAETRLYLLARHVRNEILRVGRPQEREVRR